MRAARFAGSFYPTEPEEIQTILEGATSELEPVSAMGVICPHAGYIYSGKTALRTLRSVRIPKTVVVLCPNHRGMGAPIAVSPDEAWDTPFGPVPVDVELSRTIAAYPEARLDDRAHAMEHALEVQLPLLKWLSPETRIVAISIGTGRRDVLTGFAAHLVACLEAGKQMVLASSDMSHFLPASTAREQDEKAIRHILALEADGLLRVVEENGISMCGVYPVSVMLKVVSAMGAKQAEVVEYTHSGYVTGDDSDVVAYLGVRIW